MDANARVRNIRSLGRFFAFGLALSGTLFTAQAFAQVSADVKACELTQWKNGSYVDTLAAAFAETGDYAEAARREQQALASPEFEQAEGKNARGRLALYKAGKPNRLRAAGAK